MTRLDPIAHHSRFRCLNQRVSIFVLHAAPERAVGKRVAGDLSARAYRVVMYRATRSAARVGVSAEGWLW